MIRARALLRRRALALLAGAAIACLAACGQKGPLQPAEPPPKPGIATP